MFYGFFSLELEKFYHVWKGIGRYFMSLRFVGSYDGRYWEASIMRRREALVVSMVSGPIGTVTPPNAFQYLLN